MAMQALIEAYKGRFETALEYSHRAEYELYVEKEGRSGAVAVEAYEGWIEGPIRQMIEQDSPKQRLAVYLHWNGIIGFTETIWAIAQGEH